MFQIGRSELVTSRESCMNRIFPVGVQHILTIWSFVGSLLIQVQRLKLIVMTRWVFVSAKWRAGSLFLRYPCSELYYFYFSSRVVSFDWTPRVYFIFLLFISFSLYFFLFLFFFFYVFLFSFSLLTCAERLLLLSNRLILI